MSGFAGVISYLQRYPAFSFLLELWMYFLLHVILNRVSLPSLTLLSMHEEPHSFEFWWKNYMHTAKSCEKDVKKVIYSSLCLLKPQIKSFFWQLDCYRLLLTSWVERKKERERWEKDETKRKNIWQKASDVWPQKLKVL